MTQALHSNDIKYVSFDSGGKLNDVVERFKKDPTITVFLLHAERERSVDDRSGWALKGSSGLTLTSCRVVHLLEPVLKHSFELQAIGRVDRCVFLSPSASPHPIMGDVLIISQTWSRQRDHSILVSHCPDTCIFVS